MLSPLGITVPSTPASPIRIDSEPHILLIRRLSQLTAPRIRPCGPDNVSSSGTRHLDSISLERRPKHIAEIIPHFPVREVV